MKYIHFLLITIATLHTCAAIASGGLPATSAQCTTASQQQKDQKETASTQANQKKATQTIVPKQIAAQIGKNNVQVIAWIKEAPEERKNAYCEFRDFRGRVTDARPILVVSLDDPDIFNALTELEADTTETQSLNDTVLDLMLFWKKDISKIDVSRLIALMIKQGAKLDALQKKIYQSSSQYNPALMTRDVADTQPSFDFPKLYRALDDASVAQEAEKVLVPGIAQNNLKEHFDYPYGDQAIIHAIKKAIQQDDLVELQERLGDKKQHIELMDDRGYTPLLQAIHANKPEAVKLLIQAGANRQASIKGADGTPVNALALAKLLNHEKIITLLLSNNV